jgi:hypothetical protein
MRWLRPTVPDDERDEQIEEIAASLETAALEAPPSRRAEEIRSAVLEGAGADRMPMPGFAPLALAAGALLLALAIGIGAPAVTSFIGTLLDRNSEPSEVLPPGPSAPENADRDGLPMPSDPAIPTREVPATPIAPSDSVADPGAPAGPADSAPPLPAAPPASATPTPTPDPWPPGNPPRIPLPTPPATGPPPGTPGG